MPVLAVVPFGPAYGDDRLFISGGPLDRDGVLAPWIELGRELTRRGWRVHTADLSDPSTVDVWLVMDASSPLPAEADPARTIVTVYEPEVVAPYWYRRARAGDTGGARLLLPSRDLAEAGRCELLRFPVPLPEDVAPQGPRPEHLVMINARKYPTVSTGELYTLRERVAAWFAARGRIAVYGPGWGEVHLRHPVSTLRNLVIRRVAHGPVPAKADVLRRARFALCFENAVARGYHSEKLFDAMAHGAVPIYLGDPDITDVVPSRAFVDYRDLGTPAALDRGLSAMTDDEVTERRHEGQRFLRSQAFAPYRVEGFVRRVAALVEAAADA